MVPTTGEVQTAKSIDFEEARQYTFHVTAKDSASPFIFVTGTVVG